MLLNSLQNNLGNTNTQYEREQNRNSVREFQKENINEMTLCLICSLINLVYELILKFYYQELKVIELTFTIILIFLSFFNLVYTPIAYQVQFIIQTIISLAILEVFVQNKSTLTSFFFLYIKVLHSMVMILHIKTKKKVQIAVQIPIIVYFIIRVFSQNEISLENMLSNVQLTLCVVFQVIFEKNFQKNTQLNQSQQPQNESQIQEPKLMKLEESYAEINASRYPILLKNKNKQKRDLHQISSHLINCFQVPQSPEIRQQLGLSPSTLLSGSISQQFPNQSMYDTIKGSSKQFINRRYQSTQKIEKINSSFLRNDVFQQQRLYSKECFEADILSQLNIGILAIDYKKRIIYQNSCIKFLLEDEKYNEGIIQKINKIKLFNLKQEKNLKNFQQNGIDLSNKGILEEENEKEDDSYLSVIPKRNDQGEDDQMLNLFDENFKKTLQISKNNSKKQKIDSSKNNLRKSIWEKKNVSLFDSLVNKEQSISSASSSDEVEDISPVKIVQTFGKEKLDQQEEILNQKLNLPNQRKPNEGQTMDLMYGKLIKNDDLSSNKALVDALNNKKNTLEQIIDILLDKNYWKDNWKKFLIHSDTELNTRNNKNIKQEEQNIGKNRFSCTIKDNNIILQVSMRTDKTQNEKPFQLKLSSFMAEKVVANRRSSYLNQIQKIRMVLLIELIPLQNILNLVQDSDITNFKNKIISSLSHELRTPLNCAIQMLEMLQQSDNSNMSFQLNQTSNINALNSPKSLLHQSNFLISEDVKKMFITPALNSSYLLLSMINDIIDFAQINNGKLRLNFCSFQIRELVKECIQLFAPQATMKNLQLLVTFDSQIPATINSDSNRVKQVLLALISNALKFTEKGFIQVSVQQVLPELICITVVDTGCGIPSELRSRIFRGFSSTGLKQAKKSTVFRSSILGSNQSKLTNGLVNTSTSIRKSQLGTQNNNQKSLHLTPSCLMGEEYTDSNEYWAKREDNTNNLPKSSLGVVIDCDDSSNNKNLNTQGAGLGLTIANHLAQGLGGNRSIIVDSELNKGSSFRFYIVNHPQKSKGCKLNQHNAFDISYQIWKSIQSDYSINHSVQSYHSLAPSQPSNKGQSHRKNSDQIQDEQISNIHKQNIEEKSQKSILGSNIFKQLQEAKEEMEEDDDENDYEEDNYHGDNDNTDDDEDEEDDNYEQDGHSQTDSCNIQQEKQNNTDDGDIPSIPKHFSVIVTQKKNNNSILSPSVISTNTAIFKQQENKSIFKQLEQQKMPTNESKISYTDLKHLATINQQNQQISQFDREIINLQENFRYFLISSFTQLQTQSNNHTSYTYNSLNQINSMNLFRLNMSDSGSAMQQSMVYNQKSNKKQKQKINKQRESYTNSKSSAEYQKDKRKSVDAMHFIINNKNLSETNLPCNIRNTSKDTLEQSHRDIQNEVTPPTLPVTPPQQNLTIQQQLQDFSNQKKCSCHQILIVDDNDFNLMALEMRLLRQYFFKVDKVNSGNLAIEFVQKKLEEDQCCKKHTLIFMDIDMPIKNGHQTSREILKLFKNKKIKPPTISACTAFCQESERQKARQSGMEYYITKPIEVSQLENVLGQVFLQRLS